MKRILVLFAALFAFGVNAATLVPIQLLNPAGSSSGQVITSTGPTTAPAWNGSPSLNAPTAATASIGTNTAQIATTAFVQANAVTSSSPTITTPNIVGVTNGSNAAAGSVGEYMSGTTSILSISNATTTSLGSLFLTAGDWDFQCVGNFVLTGGTASDMYVGSSTTSNAFGPIGSYQAISGTNLLGSAITSPINRVTITTSTTVYCTARVDGTQTSATFQSFLRARRIR